MSSAPIQIIHLFRSPGHNFFGHHEQVAGEHLSIECEEVACLAGRGIVGDRFLDFKPNYKGQITFFASEVFAALSSALGVYDRSPGVLRRNAITAGVDLNMLIGERFEIQGVQFQGMGECTPCYWMDRAFGAGAEAYLQGRGGLRARILTSGKLRVGASSSDRSVGGLDPTCPS